MLDRDAVDWITSIEGSLPNELPERALPQIHFLLWNSAQLSNDFIVVPDETDTVRMQLVVGNPSNRTNRSETVLCFIDQVQRPCTEEVESWEVELPGRKMAFLPVEVNAASGARIDVFLIPSEQPGYPFPASAGFSAFVDGETPMNAAGALAARARIWPFEGCGLARVLQTKPPLETHKIPVNVARNSPLFLTVELCNPDQVVRLVAIADRGRQVQIDEAGWNSPVRMEGTTALLPIDPAWFGDADEFQIAVVPNDFGSDQLAVIFSDAVSFEN